MRQDYELRQKRQEVEFQLREPYEPHQHGPNAGASQNSPRAIRRGPLCVLQITTADCKGKRWQVVDAAHSACGEDRPGRILLLAQAGAQADNIPAHDHEIHAEALEM